MLTDRRSLSFRAPEGVGEGESIMVVMNMRCARAAVWNVKEPEMEDGAGRVGAVTSLFSSISP